MQVIISKGKVKDATLTHALAVRTALIVPPFVQSAKKSHFVAKIEIVSES